jgi:hypothetical protein
MKDDELFFSKQRSHHLGFYGKKLLRFFLLKTPSSKDYFPRFYQKGDMLNKIVVDKLRSGNALLTFYLRAAILSKQIFLLFLVLLQKKI